MSRALILRLQCTARGECLPSADTLRRVSRPYIVKRCVVARRRRRRCRPKMICCLHCPHSRQVIHSHCRCVCVCVCVCVLCCVSAWSLSTVNSAGDTALQRGSKCLSLVTLIQAFSGQHFRPTRISSFLRCTQANCCICCIFVSPIAIAL